MSVNIKQILNEDWKM